MASLFRQRIVRVISEIPFSNKFALDDGRTMK